MGDFKPKEPCKKQVAIILIKQNLQMGNANTTTGEARTI